MKIRGPGESPILLLKIIKLLNKLRIPYAIVGAFAASFYGLVRASLDADAIISIGREKGKLDQLMILLKKENLKTEIRQGNSQDPIRCVINIEDKFKNRVDLLIGISGMGEDVFDRIMTASFLKNKVKIVGIEDFIAMKIFAGNAKDIQDVIGVFQVSVKKINIPLLKKLTLNYGKKELNKLEGIMKKLSRD